MANPFPSDPYFFGKDLLHCTCRDKEQACSEFKQTNRNPWTGKMLKPNSQTHQNVSRRCYGTLNFPAATGGGPGGGGGGGRRKEDNPRMESSRMAEERSEKGKEPATGESMDVSQQGRQQKRPLEPGSAESSKEIAREPAGVGQQGRAKSRPQAKQRPIVIESSSEEEEEEETESLPEGEQGMLSAPEEERLREEAKIMAKYIRRKLTPSQKKRLRSAETSQKKLGIVRGWSFLKRTKTTARQMMEDKRKKGFLQSGESTAFSDKIVQPGDYRLRIAPSSLNKYGIDAGLGLFAVGDIPANKIICPYDGELRTEEETSKRYPDGFPIYVICYGKHCIDPGPKPYSAGHFINTGRHLNNAYFARYYSNGELHINVKSKVKIPAGTEIFIAYSSSYKIPKAAVEKILELKNRGVHRLPEKL
jgi:hypothetical protein